MTKKRNRVEWYQDGVDDWRWRIVAEENGQVIAASSEGYVRRRDAVSNYERVTGQSALPDVSEK